MYFSYSQGLNKTNTNLGRDFGPIWHLEANSAFISSESSESSTVSGASSKQGMKCPQEKNENRWTVNRCDTEKQMGIGGAQTYEYISTSGWEHDGMRYPISRHTQIQQLSDFPVTGRGWSIFFLTNAVVILPKSGWIWEGNHPEFGSILNDHWNHCKHKVRHNLWENPLSSPFLGLGFHQTFQVVLSARGNAIELVSGRNYHIMVMSTPD